jgi:HK97 family phage portal protein
LFTRSIRPPDDITPNQNDPAAVPPSTVGPDQLVTPGDPHGVVLTGDPNPSFPPPRIIPSAWSGWPADWWTPYWNGSQQQLTDTAWMCLDLNASVLATMPPYLVDAAPSLDAEWVNNPDPDVYASWEEFAKQLFWDYQLGEAFVLATARYSTGWPARFHVVPPWAVEVDAGGSQRSYSIGRVDVTQDILHIRYQGSVDDAHGHGPLEAGGARQVAAGVLLRYASNLAAGGGIPPSVLEHPDELSAEQAAELQAQWVNARLSTIGEPAVLSGGVTWKPTQINPKDMALVDLMQGAESRIAVLLGVPPFLVGLPSGGDSMTYKNVSSMFDYHWRAGLRPKAQTVMSALSGWLLPRGTRVELNRDEYVRPDLLERAQTWKIFLETGVMTIDEVRGVERVDDIVPAPAAP